MVSSELLDQIARLGLFGKKYKDFASAPIEAQSVIRLLAESGATFPAGEPAEARADRAPRAPSDARLRRIEAQLARLEKGLAKIAEGLERLEQLDVIRSAASFKMDHARKIRAGQLRAARLGKQIGRPASEFDRDEARRLRAKGLSLRKIAARLGVAHTTVAEALSASVPKVVKESRPN